MEREDFRRLVFDGAKARWGELTDEVIARLDFEIDVIVGGDRADAFILASEAAKAARDAGGVQGPGRGVDVASAVVSALGITQLDPLRYEGLMIERYLCPEFGILPYVMMEFDAVGEAAAVDYLKSHVNSCEKLPRQRRAPQFYRTERGRFGITHHKCLDLIGDVLRLNTEQGGTPIDLRAIRQDDKTTLHFFSGGNTQDIAGFDTPNMRKALRSRASLTFGDLVDLYTLTFPGHWEHQTYFKRHPLFVRIVKSSQGVLLYQEQIILIARELAHFTRLEARCLFKAAGKLLLDQLETLKPKFIAGCLGNPLFREGKFADEGVAYAEALEVWNAVTREGRYASLYAHSIAYTRMAYELMYLKAHFPNEWTFALAKAAERDRLAEPLRRVVGEIALSDLRYAIEDGREVTLLLRHAERPPLDPSDKTHGERLPLTDHGRERARAMGHDLAEMTDPASIKFCASRTLRTIQTALAIEDGLTGGRARCEGRRPLAVDEVLGDDAPFLALRDTDEMTEAEAAEKVERFLFALHRGDSGVVVAVTHDVNVAGFLKARSVVESFTDETWPQFLDAAVIIRDRQEDLIEYGLIRHKEVEEIKLLEI